MTHPPITLLTGERTLDPIRYRGDGPVDKIALLPFRRRPLGTEFLLAAPLPIRNPDDVLPFAIARGTRREALPGLDGRAIWVDTGRPLPPEVAGQVASVSPIASESPAITALREGEEELGLPPSAVRRLYDAGTLRFKNYGLRVFAAWPDPKTPLQPQEASRDVRWFTLDQARAAEDSTVHPGYLPILEHLDQVLPNLLRQSASIMR